MKNRTTISIIPGGCLQFYDSTVDLSCEQLARFQNFYLEEPFSGSGGEPSRMMLLQGLGHVPYRENEALVVGHIAEFLREHASR